MVARIAAGVFGALFLAGAGGSLASAQTFVEHSAEARMQLDFAVPDAALRKMLPAGFELNIATAGAAKDANLRMIFIDRLAVTKQDGSPVENGTGQLVYLAIPVKQGAATAQMLIFGLTGDAKEAPGPFGVYASATTHKMERSTVVSTGKPAMTSENWEFAAASGEHMEIHMKYERGVARRNSNETKFYSSVNPGVYQVFKVEFGLDIMRNATVPVKDRVSEFQYKAGGGKIGALFDGTERVLSIDAQPWYNRAISQP